MSTRFYPLYQKGNPQLRIFLPNFWMKLIAPKQKQPPNVVQFHCSMQMSKQDVKNYLEKIYNINIVDVRTKVQMGRFKRERLQNSIIKEDDSKIAYVVLPKDQSFVFPDLFKDVKPELDKDMIDMTKKDMQDFLKTNKAPGLPTWFRI
ncbi:probable 39S ribosomal protein L23, mitochondrial [Solenopsis invicta]|uniref:probable 39S ribosomal protein L23, mitochondrial n=1 Tax=Solenopsis invicta TaxID=13686 RepID=UPI000595FDC3|nr:probable 39S ribosomal protein L23, mitochondrial [Solenopsis invicta]XP_025994146.1 probable 39S ribosomal protein L23, mitochondrial [Solenopsis invicta]XP_039312560.1 probable 39S ribosomal protein L23, mitochondrial [Solenopsis invicta]